MQMQQHLSDLYKQKKSLDLQWEQEHLNEGRYTLNMVKIDHKLKEVINHIKLAEAKKAQLENKVETLISEVSVAT
jgi:hypothetical protein